MSTENGSGIFPPTPLIKGLGHLFWTWQAILAAFVVLLTGHT